MKATDLFEPQHREVETLLEKIEETRDPEDQRAFFEELAKNLVLRAKPRRAPRR